MKALRSVVALGFVLLMGASPSDFRGCSCDNGDVPVPLPHVDAGFCASDDDCRGENMCADIRCVTGSCVFVSATIDRDFDGIVAEPCGDDCDDSNNQVYTGAPEQCDGVDNNCDGAIDENAPPLADAITLTDGSLATVVLPWNGSFLVTAGSNPIVGRPMDRFGNLGVPMSLMSGPVHLFRADANDDGVILMAAIPNDSEDIVLVTATSDDAGIAVVSAEHRIPIEDGIVSKLSLAHNGVTWIVAYDTIAAGTTSRHAATVLDGEEPSAPFIVPLQLDATSGGDIGVAPFASGFAVTDNTNLVYLFNAGHDLVAQIDPAIETDRFAQGPLTSIGGQLLVAYESEAQPSYTATLVQRFVAIGTAPSVFSLSQIDVEASLGPLSLVGVNDHEIMVWRTNSSGTNSNLLDLDQINPLQRSFYDSVSFGSNVRTTVASAGSSIAVVSSPGGSSSARVVFYRRCFR